VTCGAKRRDSETEGKMLRGKKKCVPPVQGWEKLNPGDEGRLKH